MTMKLKITIPENLNFADLQLERKPDGRVRFDWGPIELICQASDIPVKTFLDESEDNVADLIVGWYNEHLRQGGDPDPVADDIRAEVVAENAAGQNSSHTPGKA